MPALDATALLAPADLVALWVTLRLAAVTTALLLLLGTPLAWWLARSRARGKPVVEALVALPLVLPPTVLGFYLLVMLGPQGWVGALVEGLGGPRLVFSFSGLVIGSLLYSLPFVVQPLQNAFALLGRAPLEAAASLRASPLDRFFSVALPQARAGYITAATLGFAHTLGEFGVVLMIGGNIPGHTQVLSTAIYSHVEALEYASAHRLAAGLLGFAFVALLLVYRGGRQPLAMGR
jgi:molybdate transport system permease protein